MPDTWLIRMNYYFCIGLLIIAFGGCRQPSGPCEYEIQPVEARIVSIEPYKEGKDSTQLYSIVLRFNQSGLAKENQRLEEWVPRIRGKTNADFLNRNNIREGNIYPGTVSELKSGHCQPVHVSFDYYFKAGEEKK